MKVLAVLVTVMVVSFAIAQPPYVYWQNRYGGGENDFGRDILKTHDGYYVVVGYTADNNFDSLDVLLMKMDRLGDVLWTRTFDRYGTESGGAVVETIGWGYAIAGNSDGNVYLMRTFSDGSPVWERTYCPGTSYDIKETSDAGFVITGNCADGVFLIKTDPLGNQEWIRTYGGYEGYSVHQIDGGGYVIVGKFYTSYPSEIYIIRTNPAGDSLWTRRHHVGEVYDLFSLEPTADGGYIIGGTSTQYSPPPNYLPELLLMKLDSNCDTIWTRTYGESGFDYFMHGDYVIQTADHGFLLLGGVSSLPPYYHGLVLKTDSLGNEEWLEHIGNGPMSGVGSVVEMDSGEYMIVGSCNQTTGMGDYDVWVIAMGEVSDIDIDPVVVPRSHSLHPPYPNPFNAVMTVGFDMPVMGEVGIRVYDVLGRKVGTLADGVMTQGTHSARWDAGNMPSGIYFVQMSAWTPMGEAGDYRQVRKVVLLK